MTQRITAAEFQLLQEELKEVDIKAACLDLLHVRGYEAFRHNVGLFYTVDGRPAPQGKKGDPDYIVLHGRHPGFLMELKRPRGKAKPHQAQRIRELQMGFGLAVVVVDSARALAEFLSRHERSP